MGFCGKMNLVSADLYARGIELFNRSEFYEAHEVLEDVWRAEAGPHKAFLQGLIQVAVALHHHSTGNLVGARSLLARASRNLKQFPGDYSNLNLTRFRQSLAEWQSALEEGGPCPPFPKLEITPYEAPASCDVRIAIPVTKLSTKRHPVPAGKVDAVPMLNLQRQYHAIREEILDAVERVCASQHFILGEEVDALEKEVAAFTGADTAVACASGTDALWLALVAAGIQSGDSVLTTAFSFFASASAIARIGARPVFVDIDPRTLNLDPAKVAAKLQAGGSHKVRALLPVHLYGQCADMDAIGQIAGEFEIPVIEDAAQAIGAAWKDQQAGSLGVAAAFSFYPTKNLSAYGEAGIVTAREPEMAEHMRRLRNHGSRERYLHEELGWNCRMDAIQAAILRVKLPHVEEWNRKRRERAATYDRLFGDAGLAGKHPGNMPIALPQVSKPAHHVFHQYVIRAQRRDELRRFLAEHKISTEIYYPVPLHLQPSFAYLGYCNGDLPESERAAHEVLALPMFPELTEDEQKWVVEGIGDFYS
jgi:dTDP-4-amino-4,6-dideoxygalactose transaminase